MKRLFWGTLFLALIIAAPVSSMAQSGKNSSIGMPPPFGFAKPPQLIALPETYAYAVPDQDEDLFFHNGSWWRPWNGQWYRSNDYNSGWRHYKRVPDFYYDIDPGWRRNYKDRRWNGKRWDYERIHHKQLQKNWKDWQDNRHWEKKGTWGVKNYTPQSQRQRQKLRQQRELEYQQRPEVLQHRQQPQNHTQGQQPLQQPYPPGHRPQVQQPGQHSQGQQPYRHEQNPEFRQPEHKRPGGASGEEKAEDHGRM